ncbi:hypothetical protein AVEN_47028-1 [Araneus ventricosus]|uniref:Uncharacterized protein n=1 Tax=Araneus ventricosus TaxID=182803 RepID=A0A4Y2EZP1_ARAVE|nr:hypothetical protein AVEN_47028-1 [Araneus ventricosus]
MISSLFKHFLEENEKEKVELEEAKANRVFKKNKNGDKTRKRRALKAKKKLILNSIDNPVLSRSSTNNGGQYSQDENTHMMKIGCSVDYVRSGGTRNVPVTKAVSICMQLLLIFRVSTFGLTSYVLLPATLGKSTYLAFFSYVL